MRGGRRIAAIIPALNEAPAIGLVLAELPAWLDEVVVADNGSSDDTAAVARAAGARVVREEERGYGAACLKALATLPRAEVLVFLDGDRADHPQEMDRLVDPVAAGEADLVLGSRTLGAREPGALLPQARLGNWLACTLIAHLWGHRYTDLGPFRAISAGALRRLQMADRNYGWTVEMQIKALRAGLRVREVPVSYRRRVGTSKVSGTARGVLGAGAKILLTIGRQVVEARRDQLR